MTAHKLAPERSITDSLTKLVAFENQVRELPIESAPQVELSETGKSLAIHYAGRTLRGDLNRPLMHQLGSRLWPAAAEFSDVAERWQTRFELNKSQLESDIATAFTRHDLTVRYFDRCGAYQIYGVVSPKFVRVNQIDFRNAFLEEVRRSTALVPQTKSVDQNAFGNHVEFFHFDSPGFQVDLDYGLVYARNTGYDAYKVDWKRYILVCTNGLKAVDSQNQYKWYHNGHVDIGAFLTQTVNEGVRQQQFLEAKIEAARATTLDQDTLGGLLQRLSLAEATKQRLAERVAVESGMVGHNEWALSQALTYMGTHDRHITFRTKGQLTGFGTDILERSLDKTLNDGARIAKDGCYGLLLPSGARSSWGQARPRSSFPAR